MEEIIPLYQPPMVYCYATGIAGLSLPSCGGGSAIVPVGTTIKPYNYLRVSTGDFDTAYGQAKIIVNGVVKKTCEGWYPTGTYINCNYDGAYKFSMPSSEVTVVLEGWAWDDTAKKWLLGYKKTYILSPPTLKCNQPVKVRDNSFVNLNDVWVYARRGADPALSCRTYEGANNPGECTINDLKKGEGYTLEADPSGYTKATKNITACTGVRETLTCDKEVVYVTLNVCVRDAGTQAAIRNASVSISGIGSCTTGSDGCCALTVVKGTSYYVRVQASGYVDEGFSTSCNQSYCSKTVYMSPAGCDQSVKVIDQYGNGIPNCTILAKQSGITKASCVSGGDGRCTLSDLYYGEVYDLEVTAIPQGYVCVKCAQSVVACGSEVIFRLAYETPEIDTTLEFNIKDESGVETTILEVGRTYALRAWLKTVDGNPIEDATIWFRKETDVEIGHNNTNSSGYTGVFWIPTEQDVGSQTIRVEFEGAENFAPSVKHKQIEIKQPLQYNNFNAVWEFGYGFDSIKEVLSGILTAVTQKLTEMVLLDNIIIKGITSNSNTKTITINFDTPTQSPVSKEVQDGLVFAMKAGVLAVCIVNPVLVPIALFVIAALKFLGIFSTKPDNPERDEIVTAWLWPEGIPIEGLTLKYNDGALKKSALTDSEGKVIIPIKESDTYKIESGKYQTTYLGEVLLGKDREDTDEYTINYGVVNDIFFHVAVVTANAFNIKVVNEMGAPVGDATIVMTLREKEYARQTTDANGIAHFEAGVIPKDVDSAVAIDFNEEMVGAVEIDLYREPYPDPLTTIVVSDKHVITKMVEPIGPDGLPDTGFLLDDVECVLTNEQTGEIVERKLSNKGIVTFLVEYDPQTTYRIDETHPGLKDISLEHIPAQNGNYVNHPELNDVADVQVKVVRADNTNIQIDGATVTLTSTMNPSLILGPQPASKPFMLAPYGEYEVAVIRDGYSMESNDKIQNVSAECGATCYWMIRMHDLATPGGDEIHVKCKVVDENSNPVPHALISPEYNSVSPLPFWANYPIAQEEIIKGTEVLTTDGNMVQCDGEGNCEFVFPPLGTLLDYTKIDAYRLRAGHEDYYNENGKKGEWSESIEVVQTPASPLIFKLTTKSEAEVSYTKLLVSAAATAGLLIGGTLARRSKNPAISKLAPIAKYSSVVPGVLAVYEGGKIIVKKVGDMWPPW